MKTKNILLFAAAISALAFSVLTFTSCSNNDPAPTDIEIVTDQITSGPWKVKSVTVDGTDQTNLFTSFTLQVSPAAFTTTHGGVVWPASGSWDFTDASATKIKRTDGIEMTIESISESELILSFTWSTTTYGGGRISSISGLHRFDLIK
jgi:hypothetical protein